MATSQGQRAAHVTAAVVGVYAGLLGALHGYYELLQGNAAPTGVFINAIGAPCVPETVYHACLPAMTLVPQMAVSGVLTLLLSAAVVVWAALFIARPAGSPVLLALSAALLLVGGGFMPPFHAALSAAAGLYIHRRVRLRGVFVGTFAALYPGALVIYLLWAGIQTVFGEALNDFLLSGGGVLFPLGLVLLLLSIYAALVFDARRALSGA